MTLGLGVLTKFTFIVYAAPVGAVLAAMFAWKQRGSLSQILLPGISALAICLALVSPHFIRNQIVFGSTVASQSTRENAGIPHISASGVLSNIIRNIELHSNTGIPALTHQLNHLAHIVQGWTGRKPDDPGTFHAQRHI